MSARSFPLHAWQHRGSTSRHVSVTSLCVPVGASHPRAGHRAVRVGAAAAGVSLRVRRHAREYGPAPFCREGQGRADQLRLPVAAQEPASPSEDLAHERSFLSVAPLATPWTTSHHVSITSLCVPVGASHPCREQGKPLWAERWLLPRQPRPYCVCQKHGRGVGWRSLAFCRRAYFSSPPPREDGARSSVAKTPGSVTRFRVVVNHPWPSPSTYPSRPL